MIMALLATFGASAESLKGDNLNNSAYAVCAMRDTLDLNVPFDNRIPTEPLYGVNRGVVHAAKDAIAKGKKVSAEGLEDCQAHVVAQYKSDPTLYGKD
ncbi:hypothetical protein GKC49_14390 [Pantoea agglomerans]|uniref:Uncharacterized protein n=1 Tax=Enterobacter agglomerans TaxID=549 RepID=A0A7X2SW73_ENTAG|nr:hypothetical protein [Pantoea agglomerans]